MSIQDHHAREIDALMSEIRADVTSLVGKKYAGGPDEAKMATVELIEIRTALAGMVGPNGESDGT